MHLAGLYSLIILSFLLLELICADSVFNSYYYCTWKQYKSKHGKHYEKDEDAVRRYFWKKNVKKITKHNKEADLGIHSYWMEVNKFADWTDKELKSFRTCNFRLNETERRSTKVFNYELDLKLPASVDWRERGYVTDVKDQGKCCSSYAFSATGSLEGLQKAKYGRLVPLSTQNLVDCSDIKGNIGCYGGTQDMCFYYVWDNNGIDTELSYPYLGKEGECRFKRKSVGGTCNGFVNLPNFNETSLQAAVAMIGPISASICTTDKLMFYKDGVFFDPECNAQHAYHGVLVVGYGTQNDKDYWIVKNSWGINWGIDGYIWMSRNMENHCGIASAAMFPTA